MANVMGRVSAIEPDILDAILAAGGWSAQADDNGGKERLPEDLVARLVGGADAGPPSQERLARCGLLVLTLSVAEWGVAWKSAATPDPHKRDWEGPPSIRAGKHLMSYALGGIGLPHIDVDGAVRFFRAVSERVPAAKADLDRLSKGFHYDTIRARGGACAAQPEKAVIMHDLDGVPFRHDAATLAGSPYCSRFNAAGALDAEAWQRLRHWCRVGLRRRDIQEWVMLDWLNGTFVEAVNTVLKHPSGTLREAMVVARVLNSSRGSMLEALKAAGDEPDPDRRIKAELREYATGSETRAGRVGVMQRPGEAMRFLAAV